MLSSCLKCRKNTESKKPKVDKIKNGRIMLSSNCVICGVKKSRFIKEQEASELLSVLVVVKISKNADPDKCKYSGYGIGFDSRSQFSWTSGSQGKNVIIFWVDNSSSLLIDNKNKNMLVRGEGTTQGLDNTINTARHKCPINFTELGQIFVLSLHYNGSNSFFFVNITKIY